MTEISKKCVRATAAACVVALLVAGTAQARDLTVTAWGGPSQRAQNTVYFKPFQELTKIKINQESWDGGIGILRAKVQAGNLDWDVVDVESDELALGCEDGLYVKIDWDRIGGKDSYIPAAVNRCGVGTYVYDFVLGYDADNLKGKPASWADFFDLRKFPGKRALRRGPKTTLEIALMGAGVDPKDVYKVLATDAGVDRAFKKLDSIKSNIIWWQSGNQPIRLLASNEVALASVYNGEIYESDRDDPSKHFASIWNQALFTMDSWVILKGSPNVDQAYQLLKFMGDPKRQKDFPNYVAAGLSSKKALSLVDKKLLPNLPTTPENFAHSLEISAPFWLENYDKLNDRFVKWAAAQ